MGRPTEFRKYEGLGNDFILIDALGEDDVPTARAVRLCDRHFGIGGDGVLLVLPPRTAGSDVRMRVVNADGSVSEMCGNGVRCLALDFARKRGLREMNVAVDTDAGVRTCTVQDNGVEGRVTVDMGVIRVLGEHVVRLDGESLTLVRADAGNPHAVLIGTFSRSEVERLGPRLATHPDFPQGINVAFAHVTSQGIDLVVWERGVGITLACGTGACATAAVACARGAFARGVTVGLNLLGGRLDVTIDENDRATMRGPAKHVFSGVSSD